MPLGHLWRVNQFRYRKILTFSFTSQASLEGPQSKHRIVNNFFLSFEPLVLLYLSYELSILSISSNLLLQKSAKFCCIKMATMLAPKVSTLVAIFVLVDTIFFSSIYLHNTPLHTVLHKIPLDSMMGTNCSFRTEYILQKHFFRRPSSTSSDNCLLVPGSRPSTLQTLPQGQTLQKCFLTLK